MKRSHIRQLLFSVVLLCSASSYVFLSYVHGIQTNATSMEGESGALKDDQETLFPDMAVVKKLIDVSKFFSSFVH